MTRSTTMRQTTFLKQLGYTHQAEHGGRSTKGRRKGPRPLDSKYPVHIVLKSKIAKGKLSLLRKRGEIHQLVYFKAKKFNLRLEGFANVGNHLHIKIHFKKRTDFQKYLKSITCLIAKLVTGARKGRPFGKLWDHLAYTKVVKVWAQAKRLDKYIRANCVEADHGYTARVLYLAKSSGSP